MQDLAGGCMRCVCFVSNDVAGKTATSSFIRAALAAGSGAAVGGLAIATLIDTRAVAEIL